MTEMPNSIITILPELAKYLPPTVVGPVFIAITVAVFYWHWAKNRHLFDGQWQRVTKVRRHLKEGDIDDAAFRKILAEERDEQMFTHVFGFRLDAKKRDLLYPMMRADGSPINSWWKVKKANSYIHVRGSNIVVELSRSDKIMHYIQRLYELILVAMTVLVAALALLELATRGKDVATAFLTLISLCLVLFLMTLADSGVGTARKLEQWLKERNANAPAPTPVKGEAQAAAS